MKTPVNPGEVSAIIPAFNEALRVAATVLAAGRIPGVTEVVVVDDGSTDDTAGQAAAAGARVVSMGRNSGKGAALARGLAAARGQLFLVLDADLGPTALEGQRLLAPVLAGRCDLSIARFPRLTGRKGGFGLALGLARWGVRNLTGLELRAPLSGQRAFTRRVWDGSRPLARGFGVEVDLIIDSARRGLRILEIETSMDHRSTGRDPAGFYHRGRQLLAVAGVLAGRWRQPGSRSALPPEDSGGAAP